MARESHQRVMDMVDERSTPSPCYLIDLSALEENAKLLASIRERTEAKILLALKGFAAFRTFPLLRQHLDGVCASGQNEARLGREEFGGIVHSYSPGFKAEELGGILECSDHVSFNSLSQWTRYRDEAVRASCSPGLRINPEVSSAPCDLYDPCGKGSRLGIRAGELSDFDFEGVEGFSFHALCQQDSFALEKVLNGVEEKFGKWLPGLRWLNMGGGHHITRADYDVDHLCGLIERMRDRYGLEIFLEPGEAVALNAGYLVAEVVDMVSNDGEIAVLDASATTHMPDVLEMPYTPEILGAEIGSEGEYPVRLAGPSCLAGDVIGSYSFPAPLKVGQRLCFTDMAHYTMVKNNTFNGIPLPAICFWDGKSDSVEVVREFTHGDYKGRLS